MLQFVLESAHLECKGRQTYEQGPARVETIWNPQGVSSVTPLLFNRQPASRALSITTTTLDACAPRESIFTAYKYFKYLKPGDSGLRGLLGQDIWDGTYSVVDSFSFPSGASPAAVEGQVGEIVNYSNATRSQLQSTTRMSFALQRNPDATTFLLLRSDTSENGIVRVSNTDLFGQTTALTANGGADYTLLRSTVNYNNVRKTEVIIDYTAGSTELKPSSSSGAGALSGAGGKNARWQFYPVDVALFRFGGTLEVDLTLGGGPSAASYGLFPSANASVDSQGRTLGAVVAADNAAPGSTTKLKYTFTDPRVKTYYVGVQGSWKSPTTASNTYSFQASVKE